MFHLFKHQSGKLIGKYDFAFVKNGRYICGSNQGYERKKGVYNALLSISRTEKEGYSTFFQDDVFEVSCIFELFEDKTILATSLNPKKKYIPSTTKPKYQPKKK